MRKSVCRLYLTVFLLPIILILGCAWANHALMQSKQVFVQTLEQTFQKSITLGGILYQFPDKFILLNLSIDEKSKEKGRFFISHRIDLNFSVPQFLIHHNLVIKKIVVKKADVDPYPFLSFVGFDVMEYLKHMKRHDIDISIEQAFYQWSPHLPRWVFQTTVRVRGDSLKGKGFIRKVYEKGSKKEPPFTFDIKGSLADEGFTLTQLFINQGYTHSKFWGHLVDNSLWINGYCLRKNIKVNPISSKFQEMLVSIQPYVPFIKVHSNKTLERGNVVLSDMGMLAHIDKEGMQIKRLFLNSEDIETTIVGDIDMRHQNYALNIRADFGKNNIYAGKVRYIISDVKGSYSESSLNNDAGINIFFKPNEDSDQLSQLDLDVKNLKMNFLLYPYCFFGFQEGTVKYKNEPFDLAIPLKKTAGYMNFTKKDSPQGRLQTHLYDGSLSVRMGMDLVNAPHMKTRLKLKNISLAELTENIFNLSVIKGFLDSEMIIQSNPMLNATGRINVENAEVTEGHFVQKGSDHFKITSDGTLSIEKASTGLAYDGKNVKLTDIQLDVDDLKLRGSLVLKEDVTLNSRFSLYLTKRFIQNSKYLRSGLSRAGSEDPVQFDFKVSGYASSPNFEWADTDAKRQIQTRLPDFIERIVDDRIQRSFN